MNSRKYKINDTEYNVAVNSFTGNSAEVTVNGVTYKVEIAGQSPVIQTISAAPASPASHISPAPAASVQPSTGSGKALKSPLPGVIISLKVKVGDAVKAGQVVAILEAMKMENEIQAETDGMISAVNVSQGDSVLEGTTIVTIS